MEPWIPVALGGALIGVPALVGAIEALRGRGAPPEVGFWSLSRRVGGTCHVVGLKRGSPVVRLPLGDGEARVRTRPVTRGQVAVEVRAHRPLAFDFAARLCFPPAEPLRWRAPGLVPIPMQVPGLPDCSAEATDVDRLRWTLRRPETRAALGDLAAGRAVSAELVLAGCLVTARGVAPARMRPGEAAEALGPALVEVVRRVAADLDDLASALYVEPRVGDGCPACGEALDADPWTCDGCGRRAHRGCR